MHPRIKSLFLVLFVFVCMCVLQKPTDSLVPPEVRGGEVKTYKNDSVKDQA